MRDHELINALHRLKVETGSLACLGCEHEHNCGVHGCAIMREAADRIANMDTHILALQKETEKLRGHEHNWMPLPDGEATEGAKEIHHET